MTRFQAPTDAQIDEALRRIPTYELRRAFFEGLNNPLWLQPLAKAGLFSSPPEPEDMGGGLVRDLNWPEIEYLIRVAPDVPSAVVDILLKLGWSTNAWVKRGAFAIGAIVPPAEAARLKPLLKQWLPKGFGWRTNPREIAGFIVNLLRGGQRAIGIWVADIVFTPRPSQSSRSPSLFLEEYWFETELPAVADALGAAGLKVVLRWLVTYEREQGALTDTLDMTYFSRESIRSRTGLGAHRSVEQSLVDAVCHVAVKAMADSPEAATVLLTDTGMLLARKIAMYALADAISATEPDSEAHGQLAEVAIALLSQDQSRTDACRIEFAELVRAIALASPPGLDEVLTAVLQGPGSDLDDLRERLRRDDNDTDEELDQRLQVYIDGWRHRWLSAIGQEVLPDELKRVLDGLDGRLGVIDAPLAPTSRVISWTGPNSPVSADEMTAMSPAELLAQLESWHPAGDRWGPEPSHEGQSRELTTVITRNPDALAGTDGLVQRLRPTYLRALLSGWEAAVTAGAAIPWAQTADVLRETLLHSDQLTIPAEGGRFDDDSDFRLAKRSAVELLEELVKKRDNGLVPDAWLAKFADLIFTESADSTAWAEYDSNARESGMDPLTLSINEAWPARLRAILNLITFGPTKEWSERARSTFERELARNDSRGGSRAVLGEGLGRLLVADPDWLKPLVPELFGGDDGIDELQQVALTTAMAVHYYHRDIYALLGPSMIAAMQLHDPLAAGWHTADDPLQRIGEWVIDALIWGHKNADDPVVSAFYKFADPAIRGKAIGKIAWSFMHAETVDDEIRDRLARLWDTRVEHVMAHPSDRAELDDFQWFVTCGKFPNSWWLPRLRMALDLDPEIANQRYMMSKHIAAASISDSRGALGVAIALTQAGDASAIPAWDMMRDAIPVVIANALRESDEGLHAEATAFMNQLGESGFRDVERLVLVAKQGGDLTAAETS